MIVGGSLTAITGLILMPVPGPGGTPVFLAGLAMLATEFPWARRLLLRVKAMYGTLTPKRRIAMTTAALVFYGITGYAAWSWANRPAAPPPGPITSEVSR